MSLSWIYVAERKDGQNLQPGGKGSQWRRNPICWSVYIFRHTYKDEHLIPITAEQVGDMQQLLYIAAKLSCSERLFIICSLDFDF